MSGRLTPAYPLASLTYCLTSLQNHLCPWCHGARKAN
jgi:uncharacterized protein CbrC (UPF0167 family)